MRRKKRKVSRIERESVEEKEIVQAAFACYCVDNERE